MLNESKNDEDKLNINLKISNKTRNRFMQIINATYVRTEKPVEPRLKAEIKLYVKKNNKQSFHFFVRKIVVRREKSITRNYRRFISTRNYTPWEFRVRFENSIG